MSFITDRAALSGIFPPKPSTIGTLVVDVIREENTTDEYTVSAHPLESGATANDARVRKPLTLRLDCTITDDLNDLSIVGIQTVVEQKKKKTWRDKLAELGDIKRSSEPITVTTPFAVYKSMVITSISVTQTPDTAKALVFSVDFQKIRIIEADVTEVSKPRKKKTAKEELSAPRHVLGGNSSQASDAYTTDIWTGQTPSQSRINAV